jgi:serine/threonine protein kinase
MNSWQHGHQLKNGRFIIQQTLGEGGFGVAYLATDQELKRDVVIKTLNERVQREPNFEKFKQDFKKEAQRLSQCCHPNIVLIYDIFDREQLPCIVMEYIPGETLACRLERGVLKETEALHYIRQIGAALEMVHRKGLVHRDVKPGNIMIRAATQEAVLIDFGIAREFHLNQITIYFSKSYAPLEQYTDEPKGPYTDVYALAATLYVLLTGNHPVPADHRDRHLKKHGNDPLEPQDLLKNNISTRVINAILIGMKLLAEQRPQSIKEWLDLLTIDKDEIGKQQLIPAKKNQPYINTHLVTVNTTHTPHPSSEHQQTIAEKPEPKTTLVSINTKHPSPLSEHQQTIAERPSINTNSLELLWRSAFMGVAIWVLVISFIKLILNSEISYVVSLLLCLGFIFIAQYRLPANEPKLFLFTISVIPTIVLTLILQVTTGDAGNILIKLPVFIVGLLTIVIGISTFTLMAFLKYLAESDNEA